MRLQPGRTSGLEEISFLSLLKGRTLMETASGVYLDCPRLDSVVVQRGRDTGRVGHLCCLHGPLAPMFYFRMCAGEGGSNIQVAFFRAGSTFLVQNHLGNCIFHPTPSNRAFSTRPRKFPGMENDQSRSAFSACVSHACSLLQGSFLLSQLEIPFAFLCA